MKKKLNLTEEQLKDLYNDSWIYIMLLSTLVILTESLKTYTFYIGTNISYSVLLLPLIYLLANNITKKYGFTRTIIAITVSTLAMILYISVMYFAIGSPFNIGMISGQVLGYAISQLVNLFIYSFIINNTKAPWLLILINYMFSLIVFYLVYTIVQADVVISYHFWTGYFITLGVQLVECVLITAIDEKIKRGLI